jgi:glycosyltransferase involved in cell wall biosynthesis
MFESKKSLPHKLNICLISRKFPIVGRAADHSYLWLIAKGLATKGHKVTVLSCYSPQGKTEIFQDGVQVYYLDQNRQKNNKAFQEVIKEFFSDLHRKEAFDIVHCVDSSGAKIIKNHKQFKVATALDVEATNIAQIFAILSMTQESIGSAMQTGFAVVYKFLRTYFGGDRKLIKHSHGIFVSSPQQRLILERHYLYPDARIYNVAYGIEMSELKEKEKSEELRAKLDLPETAKILLTVTDMAELAEIKHLLQAFEGIVLKKPDTRLILVGNGPRRKEIEFEVHKLALGNFVKFTGAIKNTEVPDYISLSDIYITLSARSSGFESSVLEAMMQKKIVIASEVGALTSLIEDRKDGFLVRPADISGIIQLLKEIINQSIPTLEIGDSARRKVLSFFEPEKMINDTINAYYDVLINSGFYKKSK